MDKSVESNTEERANTLSTETLLHHAQLVLWAMISYVHLGLIPEDSYSRP